VTRGEGAEYGLPLDLLEDIFRQIIVPDYLLRSDPEPQDHPVVVHLGGQPGAGKSTVAAQLQRQFADHGGLVWVTWDDFRPFHPDYESLLAERPADMPDVTRPAARWWQDRAAVYLRDGRYNTLLEGGFRDPQTVMAAALNFADAGYQTRVSALAVPAALSRLGIIERYAAQVEATGTGRWTTAASHDADYVGTAEVLRLAHAAPQVSRISLWTRDGLVYDTRRDRAGGWLTPVPATDLLAEARDTPLTRLQRVALSGRLAETMARLEAAGLAHPAVHEMAGQVREDLGAVPAELSAAEAQVGQPGWRDAPTATDLSSERDCAPDPDEADMEGEP
jgi:UDP-N-acetylglucosamine kinase